MDNKRVFEILEDELSNIFEAAVEARNKANYVLSKVEMAKKTLTKLQLPEAK